MTENTAILIKIMDEVSIGGHINVLKWLTDHTVVYKYSTCAMDGAAACTRIVHTYAVLYYHQHALQ